MTCAPRKFDDLSQCFSWLVLGLLGSLLFMIFFIWENVYIMSIVSITHAVHFSNQEVLRRQGAHGSSNESECSQNDGKKKQL